MGVVLGPIFGCHGQGLSLDASLHHAKQSALNHGSEDLNFEGVSEGQILSVGYLTDSSGSTICTATLLDERRALTAGHCLDGLHPTEVSFGLGPDPSAPLVQIPVQAAHLNEALDVGLLIVGRPASEFVPELDWMAVETQPLEDPVGLVAGVVAYGQDLSGPQRRGFSQVHIDEVTAEFFEVTPLNGAGYCGGDSGSPLISTLDFDEPGRIIAIHQQGMSDCSGAGLERQMHTATQWLATVMTQDLPPELAPCSVEQVDTNWCQEEHMMSWCSEGWVQHLDCGESGQFCGRLERGNSQVGCLPEECGSIDALGECEGNKQLYCVTQLEELMSLDCSLYGQTCRWVDEIQGAQCIRIQSPGEPNDTGRGNAEANDDSNPNTHNGDSEDASAAPHDTSGGCVQADVALGPSVGVLWLIFMSWYLARRAAVAGF